MKPQSRTPSPCLSPAHQRLYPAGQRELGSLAGLSQSRRKPNSLAGLALLAILAGALLLLAACGLEAEFSQGGSGIS